MPIHIGTFFRLYMQMLYMVKLQTIDFILECIWKKTTKDLPIDCLQGTINSAVLLSLPWQPWSLSRNRVWGIGEKSPFKQVVECNKMLGLQSSLKLAQALVNFSSYSNRLPTTVQPTVVCSRPHCIYTQIPLKFQP